ncbi:AAA family ATPase [Paraburkholderia acidiphila]|uniref:AAA family ATPase n=1 Tax=Paraburkholderia acidiphila TaxID=2571747 RepID=A0A7Z2G701_9BURK|nr:AAA family ATPase [Paraburkholderia acidiphila]QGZ56368.1 AAA family ATPase [Paraburkholderia acidiphila]
MDQEIVDLVLGLAQNGVKGDQRAFQLRLRKIVSRLRQREPDLAGRLIGILSQGDAPTREVYHHQNDRDEEKPVQYIPERGEASRGGPSLAKDSVPGIPVDGDSRQLLISVTHPSEHATKQPTWNDGIAASVGQLIREWRQAEILRRSGLSPIRSVLLAGPPGVGKTMTATWVASELKLPLLTLDLSSVMSSFLGKTGNNIRTVLDYAKQFPCVLLLDEFDSIAKRRDDESDVGELKRLVTVLLQAVDGWPDSSLLIAATNHEELLDPAVWRRFELLLNFDLPSRDGVRDYLLASQIEPRLAAKLSELLQGQTYARLEKIVNAARKAAILDNVRFEDGLCKTVIEQLKDTLKLSDEKTLEIISLHLQGLTQREIAKRVGLAHSTVGRQIRSIFGDRDDE